MLLNFVVGFVVGAAAPTFSDAVQTNLRDISFTVDVQTANRAELRKINKDFAAGYEADMVEVQYKDPLKIRLTSYINRERYIYIVNEGLKSFSVPRLGIRQTNEDVRNAPGKWQTLFDFGVITPGIARSFLKGSYVRTDASGQLIFDVNYQYTGDKTRYRIWVDPDKRYVTRKMWFNQKGVLLATFLFENPVQSNGVWFPTRLTVQNADGKVAGVSTFKNVRANAGIADSVFSL
jgi:hypothetical protein